MASEFDGHALTTLAAGDHVEVLDAASPLHRKVGIVDFFVGDNIYVTFRTVRWSPTKMFFPEQLRTVDRRQETRKLSNVSTFWMKLRLSLRRLRQ